MFKPSQKVICVDDTNPNPLCEFPYGYVVRGRIYSVRGVTITGGVQIEGLPVIGYIHQLEALLQGLPHGTKHEGDVGWKPHRFRKYEVRTSDKEIGEPLEVELELIGSGRDR